MNNEIIQFDIAIQSLNKGLIFGVLCKVWKRLHFLENVFLWKNKKTLTKCKSLFLFNQENNDSLLLFVYLLLSKKVLQVFGLGRVKSEVEWC